MQAGASPGNASVSGTGQTRQTGQREAFSAEELAIIMSHFDIGVIDSIVDYPRGSRKAPKLLIVSEQGKFLRQFSIGMSFFRIENPINPVKPA